LAAPAAARDLPPNDLQDIALQRLQPAAMGAKLHRPGGQRERLAALVAGTQWWSLWSVVKRAFDPTQGNAPGALRGQLEHALKPIYVCQRRIYWQDIKR